jgi:CubicO group peptidase (beta-lactamase class C family)
VTERIAKPLKIESWVFNASESTRPRFVPVTRPAQVTGALGTGYVPVTQTEAVPCPATKGTATLDPNRAFSQTAYNSGGGGMSGTLRDYAWLRKCFSMRANSTASACSGPRRSGR